MKKTTKVTTKAQCIRGLAVAAAAGALLLTTVAPGRAEARGIHRTHLAMTNVTFRIHSMGQPASDTTFWVAYGPLAGQWGIVQLHPAGHGWYTANRSLPAQGKSLFTYLTGHGVAHTRLGAVPGNPVETFRQIGPISASQVVNKPASWYPPVG